MAGNDTLQLIGRTIADKYAVEAVVGEGGFATVYRAMHTIWKRPVALKVFKILGDFSEKDRQRLLDEFIQEGTLLADLSARTAAIVQARDIGMLQTPKGEHIPYMVLEWLEGATLEAVIEDEKNRRLPLRTLSEAVRLLDPAGEALALAHRKGIAHRDIKPGNVFVLGDPRGDCTVKLLDFGIAKVVTDAQKMAGSFTKTAGNVTSFTPAYGAPEQFSRTHGATGPVDRRLRARAHRGGARVGQGAAGGGRLPPARRVVGQRAPPDPADPGRHRERRGGGRLREGLCHQAGRAMAVRRGVLERPAASPAPRSAARHDRPHAVPPGAPGARRDRERADDRRPVRAPAGARQRDRDGAPRRDDDHRPRAGQEQDGPLRRPRRRGRRRHRRRRVLPRARLGPGHRSARRALRGLRAGRECGLLLRRTPDDRDAGRLSRGHDRHPRRQLLHGQRRRAAPREAGSPGGALPFCIDEFEVRVDAYKACSDGGDCKRATTTNEWDGISAHEREAYDPLCNIRDAEGKAKHPINCVDWDMSEKFCREAGKRLPTEAEWEFAARGPDGRKYPWGDDPPGPTHINACGKECVAWGVKNGIDEKAMYDLDDGFPNTAPVGSFPKGASRYGVKDVVGNVWEWVADWYGPYTSDEQKAPKGPDTGDERVIRGGAWNGSYASWVRPTFRYKDAPAKRSYGIGFRCAK